MSKETRVHSGANTYDTREYERKYDETKTAYLLYNGAIESDEDPADYYAPVKAVRIA